MHRPITPSSVLSICIALLLASVTFGRVPQAKQPKTLMLELTDNVQMQVVLVPAGKFQMGFQPEDTRYFAPEIPGHEVTISRSFYLGKYLVTQQQWQALMPVNPSKFVGPQNPVDGVSWNDANDFCRKLATRTALPVRLPTDAEWEYACKAGTQTAFFFGNDPNDLADYAWYKDNSNDVTHPVGLKKPNPWGLYDICGNVWQWCSDWYAELDKITDPVTDPKGPPRSRLGAHVLRGGAWHTGYAFSHSAMRGGDFPCGEGGPASWDNASRSGFRIAITLPISEE